MAEEGITMEIRQILAPTDFSDFSTHAIECAYELARKFGAKLLLLHVVELPVFPIEGYVPQHVVPLIEDLKRQWSLELEGILPAAQGITVEITRRVVTGTPYRKIVEIAEAENVDLIVMATRGRTGLSHLVMGSVAERVVRTASCPVLTIRVTRPTT
jgi:universal stress protein A